MKKLLLGCAALTLLFASCKKDDSTKDAGARGSLTNGQWKVTASSAVIEYPAPIGTQNQDVYSILPECQKDNLFRFNSDGNIISNEGATKCNASDPQETTNGKWTLSSDEKKMSLSGSFNGASMTIDADVITLNQSSLVLKYVTTFGGFNSTTTTTYTHQ